jgi:hypothetical protein
VGPREHHTTARTSRSRSTPTSVPCDTPLDPIEALRASNNGLFADLDFSTLSPDYASKMGIFSPGQATERAKRVRKWLRDRPEEEIVGESGGRYSTTHAGGVSSHYAG